MRNRSFAEATLRYFVIYDDFFAEALVPLWHERRYRVSEGDRLDDRGM